MCTLCSMTGTFDPVRHPGGNGLDLATIVEISDAAADVTTTYSMDVGDVFIGTVGTDGDEDWVAITFEAGETYTIDLLGAPSGSGTLSDPYLYLYDADGNLVTWNDDSNGLESSISFTATTTATYFIGASAFGGGTGTYQLEVSGPASLDELADYLTDGFWNENGRFRHSFDTSASNEITVDITGLTFEGQQLALWAFEAWEMVADITFVQVTGGADITFDDEDSGAYAGYTASGTTTISSFVNVSTDWLDAYGTTIDSYSFQTYVHEIGHALGLGHQGAYNGAATYGVDETFSNDSWQISVMSYFNQFDNTTVDASYALLLTTMMADIVAIQNLYGAAGPASITAGNTTWGANSNLGGYLGEFFAAVASGTSSTNYSGSAMAFTIFDEGGIDTLDLSPSFTNDRIDMRAEQFSDIGGLIGNVGIARGTILENLIAGSGDDTVQGNGANNLIEGRDGNDLISGDAGNDTLRGDGGDDVIHGGTGHDNIGGGAGNDTIRGDAGNDRMWGGTGHDDIGGGDGNDTIRGESGDDRIWGGTGHDNIGGGDGNDTIRGEDGNDVIYGGAGNDNIGGGAGNDLIFGTEGNNIIWGGLGADTVQGGSGSDTIYGGGSGSNQLFGNGGHDVIWGGAGNDNIGGGAGNDTIRGEAGNDTLRGDAGDDVIWGGAGNDNIGGGTGNDRIQGEAGNDRIWGGDGDDTLRGDAGNDTIWGGAGNDNIGGGAGNDLIFGSEGDNIIWGAAGNDTIHAGTGRDVMFGQGDADTFVFASAAHVGIGTGRDVIADFTSGVDRIDLSGLNTQFNGAAGLMGGGQASFYYSSAAGGLLIGDQDGDGIPDWVLELTGVSGVSAGDFIL